MAKKLLTLITVLSLTLSIIASAAFAHGGGSGRKKITQEFEDMGDFGWAMEHVVKAKVHGHMKGRAASQFAPGAPITKQEAIVATVRMMGKETEAMAMADADATAAVTFSDADKIATWAFKHVAFLVKAGVLKPEGKFNPTDNASRLYVTVLLVKSLGYEAEAQAKMNAQLAFKDAKEIPAEFVGYVAASVDHQLIAGYPEADGTKTFRPHQNVRRAEMAKLLGVADSQLPGRKAKADEVEGTVVATTDSTITVQTGTEQKQYVVDETAGIFLNGQESMLSALTAGIKVEMKLNDHQEVIFIKAKAEAAEKDEASITGTVTALTAGEGLVLGTVAIKTEGAAEATVYPLSPAIEIRMGGEMLNSLQVGDMVDLKVIAGVAVRASVKVTEVEGTISALTAADGENPAKVKIGDVEYTMAADAELKAKGEVTTFDKLKVGDKVEATIRANAVIKLHVE